MPTVLVTGATGFIGRAVCAKMLESGWSVRGGFQKESSANLLPSGVNGVYLGRIEDCSFRNHDFAGVDTVIHLAARVHVMNERAARPIEAFREVNVLGTQRLARMAAFSGVKRFIFISSVKVNGEGRSRPYTENDLLEPLDAYGISKREAEDSLLSIAAETGLKVVILRLPMVYGPGVKANFRNLIKIICSGWPLPFKGVNNRRSFIYLGNLVDAIITCVVHPRAVGEVFMVSDNQDVSTSELIKIISAAIGKRAKLFSLSPVFLKTLAKITGRTGEIERLLGSLYIDTGKIRNLLGWKPPFTLEEGIKETVKHYNHF